MPLLSIVLVVSLFGVAQAVPKAAEPPEVGEIARQKDEAGKRFFLGYRPAGETEWRELKTPVSLTVSTPFTCYDALAGKGATPATVVVFKEVKDKVSGAIAIYSRVNGELLNAYKGDLGDRFAEQFMIFNTVSETSAAGAASGSQPTADKLVVGAPGTKDGKGRVVIYDLATFSVLAEAKGTKQGIELGETLVTVPDVSENKPPLFLFVGGMGEKEGQRLAIDLVTWKVSKAVPWDGKAETLPTALTPSSKR